MQLVAEIAKQKVRKSNRRQFNYSTTRREGNNGYDDPIERLRNRSRKRGGATDTWLQYKYQAPIGEEDDLELNIFQSLVGKPDGDHRQSTGVKFSFSQTQE